MKRLNMKNTTKQKQCEVCNSPLTFVPHVEYNGEPGGSSEPYWECVNGCEYPDCKDSDLTPGELANRGKVDTNTEYGIIGLRGAV